MRCALVHKLRWDDLQFVYAVVEQGSLSAASRVLGVNHATVLRRVALLEAKNNVQIFDRSRDGYKLRPEGRVLLNSLRLMEHASARIERSLAVASQGVAGSFRLATTDSIANILLPKYLKALRVAHPNVRIEVSVSNDPIDLVRPTAEILLRTGRGLSPELYGENAGIVALDVFGNPDYLAENTSDEIEAHQWLGVTTNFARSTAGDWQFSRVAEMVEVSADSFLTLASLAAQGLGLALLPGFIGHSYDRLTRAEQFPRGPTTGIWVATHAEYRDQEHIRPLIDFFVDAVSADPLLRP